MQPIPYVPPVIVEAEAYDWPGLVVSAVAAVLTLISVGWAIWTAVDARAGARRDRDRLYAIERANRLEAVAHQATFMRLESLPQPDVSGCPNSHTPVNRRFHRTLVFSNWSKDAVTNVTIGSPPDGVEKVDLFVGESFGTVLAASCPNGQSVQTDVCLTPIENHTPQDPLLEVLFRDMHRRLWSFNTANVLRPSAHTLMEVERPHADDRILATGQPAGGGVTLSI